MRLSIIVMAASLAAAQPPTAQKEMRVRGELSFTSPVAGAMVVELDGNGAGPTLTANVQGDGSFELAAVTPGNHQLRVMTGGGRLLHVEEVNVYNPYQFLIVRVDIPPSANRSADSTISVHRLTHKVPVPAQKAYVKGRDAVAKHSYRDAADSFREAVTLDPEFADGYNELGTVEAELGDLPHSVDDFQKAVDLEPEHPYALPNLSIVLARLSRFHEAGLVARRALRVTPKACKIHFILAVSLMDENGDAGEVIDHLERATEEVPKAHLIAADVLVRLERPQDAIRHLEEYLQTAPPSDPYRASVEARLAELKQ